MIKPENETIKNSGIDGVGSAYGVAIDNVTENTTGNKTDIGKNTVKLTESVVSGTDVFKKVKF